MAGGPDDIGLMEARYANHFQIGHNELEFIFDFGQLHGREGEPPAASPAVHIARIVMAPPFAMALFATLKRAVAEYERLHGPIEKS
jgi:hypothetical protein